MHFLFLQNLSLVEFEVVCFTSAWPFWPLKVNFFHQTISFCKSMGWFNFHNFMFTGSRDTEEGQKSEHYRVRATQWDFVSLTMNGRDVNNDVISEYDVIVYIMTIYCKLEYHPVFVWVLFQDSKKFEKTHPTCLIPMTRRIQRYIICPDRYSLPRGVRSAS